MRYIYAIDNGLIMKIHAHSYIVSWCLHYRSFLPMPTTAASSPDTLLDYQSRFHMMQWCHVMCNDVVSEESGEK